MLPLFLPRVGRLDRLRPRRRYPSRVVLRARSLRRLLPPGRRFLLRRVLGLSHPCHRLSLAVSRAAGGVVVREAPGPCPILLCLSLPLSSFLTSSLSSWPLVTPPVRRNASILRSTKGVAFTVSAYHVAAGSTRGASAAEDGLPKEDQVLAVSGNLLEGSYEERAA